MTVANGFRRVNGDSALSVALEKCGEEESREAVSASSRGRVKSLQRPRCRSKNLAITL
jgi:hypothetical protein